MIHGKHADFCCLAQKRKEKVCLSTFIQARSQKSINVDMLIVTAFAKERTFAANSAKTLPMTCRNAAAVMSSASSLAVLTHFVASGDQTGESQVIVIDWTCENETAAAIEYASMTGYEIARIFYAHISFHY